MLDKNEIQMVNVSGTFMLYNAAMYRCAEAYKAFEESMWSGSERLNENEITELLPWHIFYAISGTGQFLISLSMLKTRSNA